VRLASYCSGPFWVCNGPFDDWPLDRMLGSSPRFSFGENWTRFLAGLDHGGIIMAEKSLQNILSVDNLNNTRFLDVGSGSGLFSLAARRLGAVVHSIDIDPQCVRCTLELKRLYFRGDPSWRIESGDVLDGSYLNSLGQFDYVYAWGVLHHTGALWKALDNMRLVVSSGGRLCVAVYNDQGWISSYWGFIKRIYNRGKFQGNTLKVVHIPYYLTRLCVRALQGNLRLERGMSLWNDMVDWLGGYPFEVAKPEQVRLFYEKHGFRIAKSNTCGRRHGCNEFLFVKG